MIDLDNELLSVLDFNPEFPCEHEEIECPNPAFYRMSKDCCGAVYLLCKPCGDETRVGCDMYDGKIICKDCGARNLSADQIHIDPLA